MLQAKLLRQMCGHGGGPKALGRVMSGGDVSHAAFACQVRLRLGQLPGHKYVGASRNRRLKVRLRSTAAPCNFFDSFLLIIYKGYRPI